jgi:hypothetical protein
MHPAVVLLELQLVQVVLQLELLQLELLPLEQELALLARQVVESAQQPALRSVQIHR